MSFNCVLDCKLGNVSCIDCGGLLCISVQYEALANAGTAHHILLFGCDEPASTKDYWSVYLSVCLSVHPSVCLYALPSVCLSVCLFVCLSVSVYLSVC